MEVFNARGYTAYLQGDLYSTHHSTHRGSDPFLPENRIPLPSCVEKPGFNCHAALYTTTTTTAVAVDEAAHWRGQPTVAAVPGARRNERERMRVQSVNEGFERLKCYLPYDNYREHNTTSSDQEGNTKRKFSKVDVLRSAILYIQHLEELLNER